MCGCANKKAATSSSRTLYQVVVANGRVAYQTSSKPQADKVAGRYPGSSIRTVGGPAPEEAVDSPSEPTAPDPAPTDPAPTG